jgi:hypothetical protein
MTVIRIVLLDSMIVGSVDEPSRSVFTPIEYEMLSAVMKVPSAHTTRIVEVVWLERVSCTSAGHAFA